MTDPVQSDPARPEGIDQSPRLGGRPQPARSIAAPPGAAAQSAAAPHPMAAGGKPGTLFLTGASSGLGRASAHLFHQRGWKVIATMRDLSRAGDLAKVEGIRLLQLDVTDPDQIRAATAQVLAEGDVDVVFNNAGYGLSGPMEALSDAQIRRQFETNVFGVMRVTQAFLPAFKRRRSGTFVTTTSIAGLMGFPLQSVYNATKWALEGWSEALSHELAPYGIRIRTVAPGVIDTDFGTRSLDRVATPESRALNRAFYEFITKDPALISSPAVIAETVYRAATEPGEKLRHLAGADAEDLAASRERLGQDGFRAMLAAEMAQRISRR